MAAEFVVIARLATYFGATHVIYPRSLGGECALNDEMFYISVLTYFIHTAILLVEGYFSRYS